MSMEAPERLFLDSESQVYRVAGRRLKDSNIEYIRADLVKLMISTWPDLVAPPMYENPDPRWEDRKLPDIRLIWQLAREVGYAVGVHGSLKRDFDLIAAPWTEEAVGPHELIKHLCGGMNATVFGIIEHKPLGRLAVNLRLDGWFKIIDLSICPAVASPARTFPEAVKRLIEAAKGALELMLTDSTCFGLGVCKYYTECTRPDGECQFVLRLQAALAAVEG